MKDEMKVEPRRLPEILELAAKVERMVDVRDSPAVTIAADDAYEIGDLARDHVRAMAAEIEQLRAGLEEALDEWDSTMRHERSKASARARADVARLRLLLPASPSP